MSVKNVTDLEEVISSSIYRKEYTCENSTYFDEIILKIIKNDETAFFEYLKTGNIDDVCIGHHTGNGDIVIVHLLKAIVLSDNVKIIKEFLDLYPEYISYYDHEYSLLSYAIVNDKLHIAQYLIDIGIDTNIPGFRKRTALYYVISNGNCDLFDKMLKIGADPNLEYSVPRFNLLYHSFVNCYCETKSKEHKTMCITLLKKNTKIQTEHYNNNQLMLLQELQDCNI